MLVPLADLDPHVADPDPGRRCDSVRPTGLTLTPARVDRHPHGAGTKRRTERRGRTCTRPNAAGRFALVGPGRAGTTVAAVARRRADGPRSRSPAGSPTRPRRAGAPTARARPRSTVADVGRGRRPRARRHARRRDRRRRAPRWRRRLDPARSSCTSPARARSTSSTSCSAERPDVEIGALHPLQSFPSAELGCRAAPRLVVRGRRALPQSTGSRVARHAPVPGRRRPAGRVPRGRDRRVEPPRRAARPGGRVPRTRPACPPEALLPLCGHVDNVDALGAGARSPGRSRAATSTPSPGISTRSPADERATYRALAREALRLTGRDDAAPARGLLRRRARR